MRRLFPPSIRITFLFLVLFALTIGAIGCGTSRDVSRATWLPRGSEEDGYFKSIVYYATDRVRLDGNEVRFGGDMADELTYGSVEVSIPDCHRVGELESPHWAKFWDRDNPTKYVVAFEPSVFPDRGTMADHVRDLLSQAGRDDVLMFIHGYNVSFEEGARRTAQLAYDLKFPGAPVLYSWASKDKIQDYSADSTCVAATVPKFSEFLRFVMTDFGARDVHIVAHSMGNRALVKALSEFDVDSLPEGAARLRQIVLAAPDVDAALFRQLAQNFPGKAERITLYSNKNDKALIASTKVNAGPRAGGEIVVVDGVDTIDASAVKTDFLAHGYFGNSIIPDLFAIIRGQAEPARRFGTGRRVLPGGGVYWELLAGAY